MSNRNSILKCDNNEEEVEEINIIEGDSLGNNKKPRGIKHGGTGTLVGFHDKETNSDIILKDNKYNQMISNFIPYSEIQKYNDKSLNVMSNSPQLKRFYNNKFHTNKIDLDGYEELINNLPMPLDWAQVHLVPSNNGYKFLSLSHVVGTSTFIKQFLPFYNAQLDIKYDDKNNLIGTNLILTNKFDPNKVQKYYNAPGTDSKCIIGGRKSTLTHAMKFHDSFSFLRTIYFPATKNNEETLNNMLNVMNEFKSCFTGIHPDYIKIFRYALDAIPQYYLELNTLPPIEEFTKEKLLRCFDPKKILKSNDIFYTDDELKKNDPDIIRINKNFITSICNEDADLNVEFRVPKDLFTTRAHFYQATVYFVEKGILPQGVPYSSIGENKNKKNDNDNSGF